MAVHHGGKVGKAAKTLATRRVPKARLAKHLLITKPRSTDFVRYLQ